MKIKELKPGMEKVEIIVKIVDIKKPRKVTAYNKFEHVIVEGTVGDETGMVSITVWDDTIKQLNGLNKGDSIKLSNCFITSFKGVLHINVGRDSKILRFM
ncbi:MAG: hypothetical protein ACUVV4_05460 [Candidatus Bathyarchaeia archaeon]